MLGYNNGSVEIFNLNMGKNYLLFIQQLKILKVK